MNVYLHTRYTQGIVIDHILEDEKSNNTIEKDKIMEVLTSMNN